MDVLEEGPSEIRILAALAQEVFQILHHQLAHLFRRFPGADQLDEVEISQHREAPAEFILFRATLCQRQSELIANREVVARITGGADSVLDTAAR